MKNATIVVVEIHMNILHTIVSPEDKFHTTGMGRLVEKRVINPDWKTAQYEIVIQADKVINVGPPPSDPPTETHTI
jgi:hypothetical protein